MSDPRTSVFKTRSCWHRTSEQWWGNLLKGNCKNHATWESSLRRGRFESRVLQTRRALKGHRHPDCQKIAFSYCHRGTRSWPSSHSVMRSEVLIQQFLRCLRANSLDSSRDDSRRRFISEVMIWYSYDQYVSWRKRHCVATHNLVESSTTVQHSDYLLGNDAPKLFKERRDLLDLSSFDDALAPSRRTSSSWTSSTTRFFQGHG